MDPCHEAVTMFAAGVAGLFLAGCAALAMFETLMLLTTP